MRSNLIVDEHALVVEAVDQLSMKGTSKNIAMRQILDERCLSDACDGLSYANSMVLSG